MNENLRQALLRARLSEQDVATSLGVDPKTVRRWIEGRVPYPANRAALVDLLTMDGAYLWPDSDGPLASRAHFNELAAVYPHRWAISRETWVRLFTSAMREIGILAYSGLFLAEDVGILSLIADKARCGVRVRIALGDPQSTHVAERGAQEGIGDAMSAKVRNALALYRSLLSVPNVEIRLHQTALYYSLYRADEEILVNQHTYGTAAAHSPVFHLQGMGGSDMTAVYVESFDRIWIGASNYE